MAALAIIFLVLGCLAAIGVPALLVAIWLILRQRWAE